MSTTNLFPWHLPSNKLTGDEVTQLRADVEAVMKSGDCEAFIQRLLQRAALLTPPGKAGTKTIPNRLMNGNVMGLFDSVRGMGGFRNSPLGGASSLRGSLEDRTAVVWFGGKNTSAIAKYNPSARDGGGNLLSADQQTSTLRQSMVESRALTAIHELLHFNFGDFELANAVSSLNGVKPSYEGLEGAFTFMGRRTRKALQYNGPSESNI